MSAVTQRPSPDVGRPIADAEATDVLRLRFWMHQLNEMLKKGQFKIPIHLGFGYEAAAVAMDRCMSPDDVLCLTHRNAAYNMARTKSLDVVLGHYRLETASIYGATMGSMNLAVDDTQIAYSSSILGNTMAVGCGIAMSRTLRKKPGIVFALIGDGGMEEGVFWESLIFARSHKLGIIFVLENNDFSMSSTIQQRRSPIDAATVCAGLDIRYHRASGAAVGDAKHALMTARADAASGHPALVELEISCFNQHAGPTPGWATDPMRIEMANGLLVEETEDDPVFHIKRSLGDAEFKRRADAIMAGSHG